MIRNGRFLMVDARRFVVGLGLVAAFMGALGLHAVSLRHEVRRLEQRVCAERVRALAGSAFLRDVVMPDDACLALEIANAR